MDPGCISSLAGIHTVPSVVIKEVHVLDADWPHLQHPRALQMLLP